MTADDYKADPYGAAIGDILGALDKAYENNGAMSQAEHDTLSRLATLLQLADPLARETSFTYDGDWPTEGTASANPRVMRAMAEGLVEYLNTIHPEVTPFNYHEEG